MDDLIFRYPSRSPIPHIFDGNVATSDFRLHIWLPPFPPDKSIKGRVFNDVMRCLFSFFNVITLNIEKYGTNPQLLIPRALNRKVKPFAMGFLIGWDGTVC